MESAPHTHQMSQPEIRTDLHQNKSFWVVFFSLSPSLSISLSQTLPLSNCLTSDVDARDGRPRTILSNKIDLCPLNLNFFLSLQLKHWLINIYNLLLNLRCKAYARFSSKSDRPDGYDFLIQIRWNRTTKSTFVFILESQISREKKTSFFIESTLKLEIFFSLSKKRFLTFPSSFWPILSVAWFSVLSIRSQCVEPRSKIAFNPNFPHRTWRKASEFPSLKYIWDTFEIRCAPLSNKISWN